MECEEPRCRMNAETDWKGRKVCQDHYEKYKEDMEKHTYDLDG